MSINHLPLRFDAASESLSIPQGNLLAENKRAGQGFARIKVAVLVRASRTTSPIDQSTREIHGR